MKRHTIYDGSKSDAAYEFDTKKDAEIADDREINSFAFVSRCQSVTIGNKLYLYGQTVPCIKWEDTEIKEILDAKIVAVSGIRENNVQFQGIDRHGKSIIANVSMDNVIP